MGFRAILGNAATWLGHGALNVGQFLTDFGARAITGPAKDISGVAKDVTGIRKDLVETKIAEMKIREMQSLIERPSRHDIERLNGNLTRLKEEIEKRAIHSKEQVLYSRYNHSLKRLKALFELHELRSQFEIQLSFEQHRPRREGAVVLLSSWQSYESEVAEIFTKIAKKPSGSVAT